uniref:P2Y purinoceptor 1-like n=1 Tax=Petromyzon marinus TaxID=7757 RepID=A0AAJ7XC42_PETMA|nr:P2Y purinoceptor 1-like [Petromyzon marinus]
MEPTNSTTAAQQQASSASAHPNISCPIDKHFQRAYLHPFYIFVALASVTGNAVAIWLFCRVMRPWSAITVFMFNLAVADLLYAFSLPLFAEYYGNDVGWTFGDAACKACRFAFQLNLCASIAFITLISAHRCLGVARPHRGAELARDRGHAWRASAAAWALLVPLLLPTAYFSRTGYREERLVCFDTTPDSLLHRFQPYSLAVTAVGFALPLAVVLVCYSLIAVALVKSPSIAGHAKARTFALLAIVLFTFSVNFLPYHALRNLNVAMRLSTARGDGFPCPTVRAVYVAYQVSRGLAALNTCLDPVIYTVATERVRARIVSQQQQQRRRRLQQQQQQQQGVPRLCLNVLAAD